MEFLLDGISMLSWKQIVMYGVGILLIWLAIKKDYEPSLLLPMGFGAILVNLPQSGVIDQLISGVGESKGIIQWLFETGIDVSEAMPILLFIGIGAMIDFGPLLANPSLFLFGAGAQFGIFAALLLAVLLGFDLKNAASIAVIGAARRPYLNHGFTDFEIRLYWCDCSGGVFLYGAGTADSADGNPAGDDEKGTADSYEL